MTNPIQGGDITSIGRHFRLRWEQAQQSYVLLYPEGIVQLNETAAEILKRCVEPSSFQQLLGELRGLYLADEVEADIREFLEAAASNGWITIRRA